MEPESKYLSSNKLIVFSWIELARLITLKVLPGSYVLNIGKFLFIVSKSYLLYSLGLKFGLDDIPYISPVLGLATTINACWGLYLVTTLSSSFSIACWIFISIVKATFIPLWGEL